MQTFLPYWDFTLTAKCLDYKRLGKQRVEAWQIYQIVSGRRTTGGWINHPAVKMWKGYPDYLAKYYNEMLREWIYRGYNNTMKPISLSDSGLIQPSWFGDDQLRYSHRSNLLRKDYDFYKQYNWSIPSDLAYYWPEEENPKYNKDSEMLDHIAQL